MVLRLKPGHIARLTPRERYIFRDIIGPIVLDSQRAEYLALSERYQDGDESVLPYPERSKRGVMLTSFFQNMSACQGIVAIRVHHGWARWYVKQKLLASTEGTRVYSLKSQEFIAATWASMVPHRSPFDWYRKLGALETLPGLSGRVLCALDPPDHFLQKNDEYSIVGALVRPQAQPELTPYFEKLAHLGITSVYEVPDGAAHTSHKSQTDIIGPEQVRSGKAARSDQWLWLHP